MRRSLLLPDLVFADRFKITGGPRHGGQAEVYRARDLLNREVALKVIRPTQEHTAAFWAERLRREGELIGKLDGDSSIVRIHDYGRAEEEKGDGRWMAYAVLEWMQGGSAAEWASRSANGDPRRAETATRIAIGAARGLCAAHFHEILHLDVTPDNILLAADATPKLADFGVAVEVKGRGGQCDTPPLGKEDYASPEQLNNRPVSARSDIYSLGATYVHLLTGRPPVRPLYGPPELDRSIPAVCAEVARKALDPVPDNRYKSAAEFLSALESVLFELTDPTRPAYLRWVKWAHGTLKLPVINREVPLDRVYMALRVAPTSLAERREISRMIDNLITTGMLATKADAERVDDAEELIRVVNYSHNLARELVAGPAVPGSMEKSSLTLGEAYRDWRVFVILGDPGSGKTTLARWLVRAAAESYSAGSRAFQVPTCQIDPERPDDQAPFVLGRARLPVFMRAANYAKYREDRKHEDLSLLGYLTSSSLEGYDHSPIYGDEAPAALRRTQVPAKKLFRLIQSAIDTKSALIVIDGLDEIYSDKARGDVRNAVQEFIDEHARSHDGNRVVLTSRIVGYQWNSLEGPDVAHATVERMSEPAIRHFIRSWLREVEHDASLAESRADLLTTEIFNPLKRGLHDLATNPLLAGVLTAVFQPGGRLPETRVKLFEAAIQEFLAVWEQRATRAGRPLPLTREKVVSLLEPLAESIHANRTTGLLFEDDLKRDLTRLLCAEMGFQEQAVYAPPEVVAAVDSLIELIREPIGLLVARYEKFYGFIHLAFQEYLAARYLLRADGGLAGIMENFRPRLESPRWREPLLMAIGRLGQDHPDRLIELVKLLLAEDGQYGDLVLRGTLLVVAALPDLGRCPPGLVRLLLERLLQASIEGAGATRFDGLRELIERAIPDLRRADNQAAEATIHDALRHPDLAPAAASMMLRHEWYTRPLGDALFQSRHLDSAAWGWPIHAALREMATAPAPPRKPSQPKSVQAVQAERDAMEACTEESQREVHRVRLEELRREHAADIASHEAAMAEYEKIAADHLARGRFVPKIHLPIDRLPLRRGLEAKPELLERIFSDPDWATLIVGLYGGLGDYRSVARMREYRKFANFLQLSDTERRAFLAFLKERWGEKDPIYDIAVHLDTLGGEWAIGSRVRPDFQPQFLAQESPLTEELILPALQSGRRAAELVPDLTRIAKTGDQTQRCDAILSLILLGASSHAVSLIGTQDAHVWARLALAFAALRDPVARMSNHIVPGLSVLAQTEPVGWSDVVSATLAVMIEDSPAQVDTYALYAAAPAADRPYALAEHLVDRFLGGGDDAVYYAAVTLDTVNTKHTPPEVLIRALSLVPITRHRYRSAQSYRWNFEQVPPRSVGADDIPAFVLTAVENIDRRISMVRMWAIGQVLLPVVRRQPELLPELLTIALRDVGDRSDRDELANALVTGQARKILNPRALRLMAEKLKSHYFRARAMLRLLPFFPADREELLKSILADIRLIEGPHQYEQAMERLLAAVGGSRQWILQSLFSSWFGPARRRDKDGLVFKAHQAAMCIPDPDDRARALARLASYLPTTEAKSSLFRALRIVMYEVRDETRQAETIRLLVPQFAGFPDLKDRIHKLAQGRSARVRAALFDHTSPAIGKALPSLFRLTSDGTGGWAVVAAAAKLRDVLPADPTSCDPDILWGWLAADFRPGTIAALRSRAESEGLTLTRAAAHVVDRLDEEQLLALDAILPYLHSPEPETSPLLVDWVARGPAPLGRQAALLLAERHGLTMETLSAVVDGMRDKNDLIRLRAMRVVQHPSVTPEYGPTRPASVVGLDVLMDLKRSSLASAKGTAGQAAMGPVVANVSHDGEETVNRASMRHVVCNLSSDLIHDSAEIFRELIDTVRRDPWADQPIQGRLPREPDRTRAGVIAESLLADAEAITDSVWGVLLDGLAAGPIPVRMALLLLLMRMTYRSATLPARYGLTPDRWSEVVEVLDRLNPDEIPHVGIYLGGVDGIIDAATTALESATSPESWVAVARTWFTERQIRPLRDLLAHPPEGDASSYLNKTAEAAWRDFTGPDPASRRARLLVLLSGLGSRLLFGPADCRVYLRPSATTERRFRRSGELLEVLCDWLRDALSRGGPELGVGQFEPELLLAVAQGASIQPEVLPLRLDRDELMRLLVAAAQLQSSRIGRCAAIILLGRLLVADAEILPAISTALLDVDDVRDGALIAATLFKRYSPGFLEKLAGDPEERLGLYHESAIAAFGFGTMLETLGRSDRTDTTERQWILSTLAAAVRHPSTDRVVHLGYTAAGLPELPMLNQLLYRMLLRVAGVESPKPTVGSPAR